jgi:hypothetical protein
MRTISRQKVGFGAGIILLGAGLSLAVLAQVACDEKKIQLAPVASSLASSVPLPPGATVRKFVLDGASKTSIEMDAPKEKIKATTSGGTGSLDIDLANLTASRGEVKMDLSTLTTNSFSDADDNKAQTTHARTWLEVGDGTDGKLENKLKETNRYAVYAIRSVENPSASDVTKLAPTKEGNDEVRTVTVTTRGELLIHGHKVDRDAELEVKFLYDPGAPPDKPKAALVSSKKPFHVVLAEHDVKPRDGFGKIAKGSFHLLGTKVADNADIALDLRAKPAS